MISFPLYTLLFIYFLFLAVFVVFILINLYHILEAQIFSTATFLVTFFVISASLLIVYFTWEILSAVDWQQQVVLFNPNWFQ